MSGPPDAVPARLRCVECGADLPVEIGSDGVTVTAGNLTVRLRRRTDYLACESCFSLYRVADLQRGPPARVTDELLA
jgi:hypothetical protein